VSVRRPLASLRYDACRRQVCVLLALESFVIRTDVSGLGLCAVLLHHGRVVVRAFRQSMSFERDYPSHDPDLAVVLLFEVFRGIVCTGVPQCLHWLHELKCVFSSL
jgi:hypothetical protein